MKFSVCSTVAPSDQENPSNLWIEQNSVLFRYKTEGLSLKQIAEIIEQQLGHTVLENTLSGRLLREKRKKARRSEKM